MPFSWEFAFCTLWTMCSIPLGREQWLISESSYPSFDVNMTIFFPKLFVQTSCQIPKFPDDELFHLVHQTKQSFYERIWTNVEDRVYYQLNNHQGYIQSNFLFSNQSLLSYHLQNHLCTSVPNPLPKVEKELTRYLMAFHQKQHRDRKIIFSRVAHIDDVILQNNLIDLGFSQVGVQGDFYLRYVRNTE